MLGLQSYLAPKSALNSLKSTYIVLLTHIHAVMPQNAVRRSGVKEKVWQCVVQQIRLTRKTLFFWCTRLRHDLACGGAGTCQAGSECARGRDQNTAPCAESYSVSVRRQPRSSRPRS